jgi:regulatory protein
MNRSIIKNKLERYCALQDRCVQEVRNKMRQLDCPVEWEEEIKNDLIENNYLDENRFANAFVRGHFRLKGWGKLKINSALLQKGISIENINSAINTEIGEEEYFDKLIQIAQKKITQTSGKELSPDSLSSLIRYLQQKGYELEIIFSAIKVLETV